MLSEGMKWGKEDSCVPGRGWESKDLCSGEHNGPRGHFHCLWKWLVAKRSENMASGAGQCIYNHSPHLPHASPLVCMVLSNIYLGILLNLPLDYIE